jgi:hypothetical protein
LDIILNHITGEEVNKMVEGVACHKGKCWEVRRGAVDFEDLFEPHNIVDEIEQDLWKNNFYGS